ncbi:MAG TPA: ATP-dependent helicase, partial [Marmoricola sp.]
MSSAPAYRLASVRAPAPPPELDEAQQRVVDHSAGPLLVLAGPGTGKTTTLVEAIVDRVDRRGAAPDSILALTFSRKAAEQLRDRVSARLGRTTGAMMTATFHSFAYALVRKYSSPDLYTEPMRLLSAAEQDVIVRGLLDGPDAIQWPRQLKAAVGTRGFARELGELMARTTERGLGSQRLHDVAIALGRDDLRAAAEFMETYDRVLGNLNALDYSTLIADAVGMLQEPDHPARADLRRQFTAVFVDEYQDTDPSQVALLQAIAGDGRDLVVVGDPHQSIYAFRGADVGGILDFPHQFPSASGAPADVVVLATTRRFGTRILTASQRIAHRIGMPGSIPAEQRTTFGSPQVLDAAVEDVVEVLTFDTERAEVEGVADLLRRAHLEDDVPWSQMAVLVRSGRSAIPTLRRSLVAAGVPVEVSADETPLVREPAVLPLLAAMRAVADPDALDPDAAHALLVSPLCGLDVTEVRALARALRQRDHRAGVVRPSTDALCDALRQPTATDGIDLSAAARVGAFARLLRDGRDRLADGGTAEEVLWSLWSGTRWPERLRAATERGGTGARYAHRDLDAIVALFETAARAEEQQGHTGIAAFLDGLEAQQIPADTLADRGVRGDAVRLLTAHRSKGLEWTLVVATHVQEGSWPDLRRRSSLLDTDRISHDGLAEKTTLRELLAEERRLFYVACTRARRRLVVTAVASSDDDGEQPSRFLGDLCGDALAPAHRHGRPPRSLSLAGIVAELRRTLADDAEPEGVRRAAARRLRRL